MPTGATFNRSSAPRRDRLAPGRSSRASRSARTFSTGLSADAEEARRGFHLDAGLPRARSSEDAGSGDATASPRTRTRSAPFVPLRARPASPSPSSMVTRMVRQYAVRVGRAGHHVTRTSCDAPARTLERSGSTRKPSSRGMFSKCTSWGCGVSFCRRRWRVLTPPARASANLRTGTSSGRPRRRRAGAVSRPRVGRTPMAVATACLVEFMRALTPGARTETFSLSSIVVGEARDPRRGRGSGGTRGDGARGRSGSPKAVVGRFVMTRTTGGTRSVERSRAPTMLARAAHARCGDDVCASAAVRPVPFVRETRMRDARRTGTRKTPRGEAASRDTSGQIRLGARIHRGKRKGNEKCVTEMGTRADQGTDQYRNRIAFRGAARIRRPRAEVRATAVFNDGRERGDQNTREFARRRRKESRRDGSRRSQGTSCAFARHPSPLPPTLRLPAPFPERV